ncbi:MULTISPECIES: GNAT family N-acetyltransferase [Akkermansia]|uniref:GNAT family N-acetyltransferase n=1 Tax=Akkermansia TaxID=239934 RepID=UPI000B8E57E4|nr:MULTISPECIES: GNAT family N-acetyltransferase [Akkermansia]HBI12000.1 GNAT family N-acetyltransferase [Akkermansia sp.]HBN18439.1 GNAT family N-acetyltransferase [Akkermansia sp.]
MKIEHYQNRDETEVLNIWLKASEQAHSFAGVGFWCGLVEDMRQVYLPRARTWVCRDGGRVVGFACLVGEGELAALFVAPERQCEGIGTALLDWVKEHSKGMLTVGVYEENARARAFYRRGGFEEIGSREDELTGSREYRMEWKRESM